MRLRGVCSACSPRSSARAQRGIDIGNQPFKLASEHAGPLQVVEKFTLPHSLSALSPVQKVNSQIFIWHVRLWNNAQRQTCQAPSLSICRIKRTTSPEGVLFTEIKAGFCTHYDLTKYH